MDKRCRSAWTIFFCIPIIVLNSCYVERKAQDMSLKFNPSDKLSSYTDTSGIEHQLTIEENAVQNTTLKNDTVMIDNVLSGTWTIDSVISTNKISLSEIRSFKILPAENRRNYLSVGPGFGKGFNFNLGYTFSDLIVGGHIGYTGMIYDAEDTPPDYTGLFNNDNLNILSFMVTFGGKPSYDKDVFVGFEIGPSYVNHIKETYEPNPDYYPNYIFIRRYFRDNIIYNMVGLSSRIKVDFKFSRLVGIQLSLFSNFNANKSMAAFQFLLIIGK